MDACTVTLAKKISEVIWEYIPEGNFIFIMDENAPESLPFSIT
jgi:hypothetical protein